MIAVLMFSGRGSQAGERLGKGKAQGIVMAKCNLISAGGTRRITNDIVSSAVPVPANIGSKG